MREREREREQTSWMLTDLIHTHSHIDGSGSFALN